MEENRKKLDNINTYNKFIDKISQITKNNKNNNAQQNRRNESYNYSTNEIKEINNNERNYIPHENHQNHNKDYERMNQLIIKNKRKTENFQNSYSNKIMEINGNNIQHNHEIKQNKIICDNSGETPLGGGKNAPIVRILNERINQDLTQSQSNQLKNSQNNGKNIYYQPFMKNNNNNKGNYNYSNNPFRTVLENDNDYVNNTNNVINQNKNENNIRNDFQKNNSIFLENSKIESNKFGSNNTFNNPKFNEEYSINYNVIEQENSESPKKESRLMSSLIYGLIFGTFGTLLLWYKDKKFRRYIKSCYRNINYESIISFLKNPIQPIKSIINNLGNYKEILKECLNWLYQIIDDYSDFLRLLALVVIIFALWLIIKKIALLLINYYKKENIEKSRNHPIIY